MPDSVRRLMHGAIDYAGLFPPAGLSMADAVAKYRAFSERRERWMLGRFVAPVSRLTALEAALVRTPPSEPWRISALAGTDVPGAVPAILAFNAHVRDGQIDWIEAKAENAVAIEEQSKAVPDGFVTYWEIPVESDPAEFIQAIARSGGRAKIRTGGMNEQLFPSAGQVARFIRRCDEGRVAFKATAGLHHALRGDHPLTYEKGSASCTMHGFLNVLLAAAFIWGGISDEEMKGILSETEGAFRFTRVGVQWRDRWVSRAQIQSARERLAISFGSCSLDEPVAELKGLELLS